jgi:SAM-dependent methyltransferase
MISSVLFYSVVAIITVLLVTAAYAGFSAAPFVPTFQKDVVRMLTLARVGEHDTVADLGAGDGRFLITAAKRFGARGVGYELSILMYLIASLRIALSGTRHAVRLRCADFYRADLSKYDVICCFLTPMAMRKLEPKFLKECRPGTRVVSYAFRLPNIEPDEVSKPTPTSSPIFLYHLRVPHASV